MKQQRIMLLVLVVVGVLSIGFAIFKGTTQPIRVLPTPPEVNYDISTIQAANVMITSTNVTIEGTEVKHGSGVVLYEEIYNEADYYYVVTNSHVVEHTEGVNLIKITDVNNQIYEASIVEGSLNPSLDLVLLRFLKQNELVVVSIDETPTQGELVVAIGFNQQEYKVTYGTIDQLTSSTILHNALSYPGFSGGGLYNANLEIVGINVQIIMDGDEWVRSISIPSTVLVTYLGGIQNG